MALSIGTRLGPDEVLATIGAGGMGSVYLARDPRMGRDVAIKVTSERFSDRFSREVHAVAALNHPHICQLYDVGPDYLVMELCEGETLADRIDSGPLPRPEALRIAAEIAGALTAAHAKGIVHRDLKPGNIMLTKAGVKVLDFGLAKIAHTSTSDTRTETLTAEKTILGTVPYMSPEQAQGKEVDARSDIFSFGLVFYEMLTGKRAFPGSNPVSIIAAILERDAPSLEPQGLNRVVQACLAKDPADRFQSARDLLRALEWGDSGSLPAPLPQRGYKRWLGWAAAALAAVAWIATSLLSRPNTTPARPFMRLDVDLGDDVSLVPVTSRRNGDVAISRDGTRLAYISGPEEKLFVRRLDQPKGVEVSGVEGAMHPFFSPDGQWIGFLRANTLCKVPIDGGAIIRIGEVAGATFAGAVWSEDGAIIASESYTKGLLRFRDSAAAPETLAALGNGEIALARPWVLPGGKAILFAAHTTPDVDKATIEVLDLATGKRKVVVRGGQSPRYLPASDRAGHLLYVNRSALLAVPFDLEKLETRGPPVPILNDIASGRFGNGDFDVTAGGMLVYRGAREATSNLMTLQWLYPGGKRETLIAKPRYYKYVSVSPDNKRVAFIASEETGEDLWVYDPHREAYTRITTGGAYYSYPRWTPDGEYLLFGAHGQGILYARADGSSQPQLLVPGKTALFPWSFTPDGKWLTYDDLGVKNWQIWTVPIDKSGGRLQAGNPERFESAFSEMNATFSPDGKWLAYESNESGRFELYVRPFPASKSGRDGKWQVSSGGGSWAQWLPQGNALAYYQQRRIMITRYATNGDTFVPEKSRVWIDDLGLSGLWQLAPDGKRIVITSQLESAGPKKTDHYIVLLENLTGELRRRVPAEH